MKTEDQTIDFLVDDDFIHYVLEPTPELQTAWSSFFVQHPSSLEAAQKARNILLGDEQLSSFPEDAFQSVKQAILLSIRSELN